VVTLWTREDPNQPAQGLARIALLSPDEEALIEQVVEVDLREAKRMRSFGRIIGLPARGAGRYHFRIETRATDAEEWHEVDRVPLQIEVEPAPEHPADRQQVEAGAHQP
jgi:hypothetical protein